MASDWELAKVLALRGTMWAVPLLGINLALKAYVKRNPSSKLAQRTEGGSFDMEKRGYVVCLAGQIFVQPALWMAVWTSRDPASSWWYGAQRQFAAANYLAYSAGYFAQDLVAQYQDNSALIVVHHVASIVGCFGLCFASSWQGLLITTAQFMELGSIALGLGDLHFIPRHWGQLLCIFSSVLPSLWILLGMATLPPTDIFAWFCALGGIVVAVMRVKEAWSLIKTKEQ